MNRGGAAKGHQRRCYFLGFLPADVSGWSRWTDRRLDPTPRGADADIVNRFCVHDPGQCFFLSGVARRKVDKFLSRSFSRRVEFRVNDTATDTE